MPPRKNRISKKSFLTQRRNGLRIDSPLFSGVIHKTTGMLRIAIVVSKKVAKTAIMRNRIRRRFYHAVTFYQKHFTCSGPMILYPKKEALLVSFSTLKSEIGATLRQAGIINTNNV